MYITDRPALKNARVVAILKDGKIVGKILGAFSTQGQGRLYVSLWDWTEDGGHPGVQEGSAKGYGYDKFSAALTGMKFAGVTLQDHPRNWETQLREAGFVVETLL